MNITFATDYICRRMEALGYGCCYYLRYRHFVVRFKTPVVIEASSDIYFLMDEVEDVTIESEMGQYDLSNVNLTEQVHEFSGEVTITSHGSEPVHVRLVQAIPKHNKIKEEPHADTV